MMKFIIPRSGVFLRDPRTKVPVPPEGVFVEQTTFWNRRLRDGDITMHDNKPESKAPADAVKPAEAKKETN